MLLKKKWRTDDRWYKASSLRLCSAMNEVAEEVRYPSKVVRAALMAHFAGEKTKIGVDTSSLCAELLRSFVLEAVQRARRFATESYDGVDDDLSGDAGIEVLPEHINAILPQLIMDFC